MIFVGEITNETTLQLATALADLSEATTPPDDGSTLYAQVYKEFMKITRAAVTRVSCHLGFRDNKQHFNENYRFSQYWSEEQCLG